MVAFGANEPLGDTLPSETLRQAALSLVEAGLRPVAASRLYRTPAVPRGSGPDFVNAVAVYATLLVPGDLLALLHAVERAFGRRRERRWAPRTLDLDLLAVDDQVLPDPEAQRRWREREGAARMDTPGELILPHPRLQERAFVLVPLAEAAPGWRHPLTGLGAAEMLGRLPPEASAGVTPAEPLFNLSSGSAPPK